MKIGIYDPYLDDLGGGEKYMMSMAKCLAENNDVYLFWDNKKDLDDLEQRFSLGLEKIILSSNIFSPKFSTISRLRETKNYDVIIYLSDGSIPFTLSKKLYVHIQQPLKNLKINSLKDKLKLRHTTFFCNSEFTKTFISKKTHKKVKILYPPVALFPKDTKKDNTILHVGRFRVKNVEVDDYKKQFFMVETFKKMVDNGLKNWKFILAVSVKKNDEIQFSLLRKAAKGYPIIFFVNKTNTQLWDLYSKAKIYWHASGFGEDLQKNPEYAEHFGISTVEAMGAGVVPVVINAGGQKEIVKNNVTGLLWNTQEELISSTLKLIKNPKTLEKLSITAKKRANYFAGERFCEETKKLIS